MKKIIALVAVVLLLLSVAGCGTSKPTIPDYPDANAFEAALNAGEDLTGKTVCFTADKLVPDSAFGYNLQAGEHLNFCSEDNPKVSAGDTVTVKVKKVTSMLGSWIISYEMVK